MAPFNLAAADKILKDYYLPAVREQLNTATVLLANISRNEEDVSGKKAVLSVHKGRNQGVGARADYADLPKAGHQAYEQPSITMKYNYGRIEVTGPTIAATRSDAGAFVRTIQSEMDGLLTDIKKDFNRQLFGDGTGKLCTLGAASASATVTITDTAQYLEAGMSVDIVSGGSVSVSGLTIVSVDRSTPSVTFDQAVTTLTGDILVRSGSYNEEVEGLARIVDDSNTYANINRSDNANEFWRANVDDNGGTNRAISESLMQVMWDEIGRRGGVQPDLIITTDGVRRAYMNTLTSLRRFVNTIEVKGGFSGPEFNNTAVIVDYDCPPNTMYFLRTDRLALYRMSDWDWLDKDGAILHRVSNKDAYEAVLYKYANLGSDRPNALGVIKDITEA